MIGKLSYFLGLQIKQLKNGTFVSKGKYIKDMLKKFGMNESKSISTPMGTNGNLDSVGFINPRSPMDPLPSKNSAQQTA